MAYGGRGLQVASVTVSRGNESDGDVPACASAGRLQGSPMTAPIPRCAIARPRLRVSDVSIRVGMPGVTFCAQIGVNAAGQRLASEQAATNPHRHGRPSSRLMDFRVGRYDV